MSANLDRFAQLFDLSGRVAVVTGAGRGNGVGIANALVDAGAKVVAADLEFPPAGPGEEGLRDAVVRKKLDITDEGMAEAFFAEVNGALGSVDILVNNAGISFGRAEVDVMEIEKFHQTFQVNVLGTLICTKVASGYMKRQQWGRIVNISSSSAFLRTKGATAYSTSKVSISHLTRVWGNELAPYNVLVNALCPSFVLTPMTEKTIAMRAEAAGKTVEQIKEETLADIPLHRFIELDEVSNWVVLLCSEFAKGCTATNFSLTGGLAPL